MSVSVGGAGVQLGRLTSQMRTPTPCATALACLAFGLTSWASEPAATTLQLAGLLPQRQPVGDAVNLAIASERTTDDPVNSNHDVADLSPSKRVPRDSCKAQVARGTGTASATRATAQRETAEYVGRIDLRGVTAELVSLHEHRRLRVADMPEIAPKTGQGRRTLLYFWGAWCGPCLSEMPHLSQVATAYADNLTVIGLSDGYTGVRTYAQQVNEVRKHTAAHNLTHQYFTADDKVFSLIMGNTRGTVPALALFGEDGKLAFRSDGSIEDPQRYAALVAALDQSVTTTCQ